MPRCRAGGDSREDRIAQYVRYPNSFTLTPCRFWSFHSTGKIDPIQNSETQRTKLNDIRSEITRLSGICCNQDVTEDAIRQMQSRVSDLELKVSDLAVHLNRLLQSDPATIKKLSEGIGQVKHFANICTENIFVMRQYFVRKFGACEEDIDKEFGIPSDFDCL